MRLGLRRFAGAANGDATTLDGLDSTAFSLTGHTHAPSGVTDHSLLANLDFASSGHTGFEAAGTAATHAALTATHGVAVTIVGTTDTQTLTNKTLTTPTIASFANATHTHADAAGGGTIAHGSLTGLTTGDPHTQYLLGSAYTAADVLSKLLTVDGAGSGIDADLLDGNSSAAFEVAGTSATHAALTAAHGATGAVVGTTNSQTLTNKTLTAPVIGTIVNTGTLTLPTSTDTLVARDTTDTLTNKTLTSPTIGNFTNANHTHADAANGGTIAHSALTGLTTGNPHTQYVLGTAYTAADVLAKLLTVDGAGSGLDADLLDGNSSAAFEVAGTSGAHAIQTAAHGATGAVVGTTNSQTLTNKTLTSPTISTISNTGTLTLPTSTDTLVGRATTDTLTNKTLTSPVLTTATLNGRTDLTGAVYILENVNYPTMVLGRSSTRYGQMTWDDPNGEAVFQTYNRAFSFAFDASFLRFLTLDGTERMRIDSSGVGIGVSATAKLQVNGGLAIKDGISAPSTISGYAYIYVDSADGDLKVKFGDGTVKTLATDT